MAPINPPTYQQASTYSARLDRLSQAAMLHADPASGALAVRGGVRPTSSSTGLLVTQRATPAMFVTVAAGTAYVPSQSAVGGVYVCHNDASYDVAISAAHATLTRRDLIVARVRDAEYAGSENTWSLEVVQGTPAGSPGLPSTPAGAVALAQVQVPSGVSTITNARITDLRTYTTALGGVLPVPTTARPTQPYEGMAIYDTSLDKPYWYNGSTWHSYSDEDYLTTADLAAYLSANGYVTTSYLTSSGYLTQAGLDARAWNNYSANWGASDANPSLGNGTLQGRYITIGKMCTVHIGLNIGSSTGKGGGEWSFTVPFTPAGIISGGLAYASGSAMLNNSVSGVQHPGTPYLRDIGGVKRVRIATSSGTTVADVSPTVPFNWSINDDLDIVLTYEMA